MKELLNDHAWNHSLIVLLFKGINFLALDLFFVLISSYLHRQRRWGNLCFFLLTKWIILTLFLSIFIEFFQKCGEFDRLSLSALLGFAWSILFISLFNLYRYKIMIMLFTLLWARFLEQWIAEYYHYDPWMSKPFIVLWYKFELLHLIHISFERMELIRMIKLINHKGVDYFQSLSSLLLVKIKFLSFF